MFSSHTLSLLEQLRGLLSEVALLLWLVLSVVGVRRARKEVEKRLIDEVALEKERNLALQKCVLDLREEVLKRSSTPRADSHISYYQAVKQGLSPSEAQRLENNEKEVTTNGSNCSK